MRQTLNFRKQAPLLGHAPCLLGSKGRSTIIAASQRSTWQHLGGLLKALTLPKKISQERSQVSQPAAKEVAAGTLGAAEHALPTTFQKLSPRLCILWDPKNDRLIYLVGVDEASGVDSTVNQVRALLRAAAAPYLHLLALPEDLRRSILREFPGGSPIITRVPLSEAEDSAGSSAAPDADDETGQAGLAGRSRPDASAQRSGGVLSFLYGPHMERRPGGIGAGSSDVAAASALGSDDDDAAADYGLETPADLPDEIMLRRKKVPNLMAWRKGASMRVARHRDSRAGYKLGWLVEDFNQLGHATAFLASPNLMFVRNNIVDSLATDYSPDEVFFESGGARLVPVADDDDSDDDDDDDDEGGGHGGRGARGVLQLVPIEEIDSDGEGDEFIRALVAADEDDEDEDEDEDADGVEEEEEEEDEDGDGVPVVVLGGDEARDLEKLLKAIGMIDSDSDDDDSDGEAQEEGEDEEAGANSDDDDDEAPPTIRVIQPGGDQREASEGSGDADGSATLPLFVLKAMEHVLPKDSSGLVTKILGLSGIDDDGSSGSDDDDPPFNMDVPLTSGPMGWTLALRVRDDKRGGGGKDGSKGARNPEMTAESAQDHAVHLNNVRRLEALWKQKEAEAEAEPEQSGRQDGDAGPHAGPSSSAPGAAAAAAVTHGGSSGSDAVKHRNDGEGGGAGAAALGPGPGPVAEGSLEEDWRAADSQAAAATTTTGLARQGLGIPTDRLMRPARRPQSPAPGGETAAAGPAAAAAEASASGAAAGPVPGTSRSRAGLELGGGAASGHGLGTARQAGLSVGASLPDGDNEDANGEDVIVSSTRRRHGADAGAGGAGSSSDESGPAGPGRPTGRSRMVRRARHPQRHNRHAPASSVRSDGGSSKEERGASKSAGTEATAGAMPLGDAAAASPSAAPGTAEPDPGAVGSDASGAIPIPAYRHLRPVPGANTGASSAMIGNGVQGPSQHSASGPQHPTPGKPVWSRLGPHAAQGSSPAASSSAAGPSAGGGASSADGARADGGGSSAPEAAGYAPLDLDQLAQFVLGRRASLEEVQDLASAVAQSAEVEESFSGGFGGGGVGTGVSRYRWQRPGTPPPSLQETLLRPTGCRRGAVKPRRQRLRVPSRVLALAKRQVVAAEAAQAADEAKRQQQDGDGEAEERQGRDVGEEGEAPAAGRLHEAAHRNPLPPPAPAPPPLPPHRAEAMKSAEAVQTPSRRALPPPVPPPPLLRRRAQRDKQPSQEEQAATAVRALRSAPAQQVQLAEALLAFLRGRPPPQSSGVGSSAVLNVVPLLGRRSQNGHVGLARGRDAVVALPRELLEVVSGAWHVQEERLMHPDVRRHHRSD